MNKRLGFLCLASCLPPEGVGRVNNEEGARTPTQCRFAVGAGRLPRAASCEVVNFVLDYLVLKDFHYLVSRTR